jgi:hypothetical protein
VVDDQSISIMLLRAAPSTIRSSLAGGRCLLWKSLTTVCGTSTANQAGSGHAIGRVEIDVVAGAGSMQLAPVSEAPEGTSQEASLKGLASGTVTRSAESVSSPLPTARPERSPSSSTEAVPTEAVPPVRGSTAPVKPDEAKQTAAAAVVALSEPHRGEKAAKDGVAKEAAELQQQEPLELVGQQEEGVTSQQQELATELAAVQLGGDAVIPGAQLPAAAAAAAEIGCSATPFAAAAQQRPPPAIASGAAAAASEAAAAGQQRGDSGERPAATAALSHGGSALPFASSVASALSEAQSLAIPSLPAAGIAPIQARDPPGPPLSAEADAVPAPGAIEGTTAPEAEDDVEGGGTSPAVLSQSGGSDTSAEQW